MSHHDEAVAAIVDALVDHFRPYGWTDRSLATFTLALADLPLEPLRYVAQDWMRTGDRMPLPVDLRRAVLDLVRPDGPPAPEDAWAEVLNAARMAGRRWIPQWSHELIGEALAVCGGYVGVCNSELLAAERKNFLAAYSRLAHRHERDALTAPGLSTAIEPVHELAAQLAPPLHLVEGGHEEEGEP